MKRISVAVAVGVLGIIAGCAVSHHRPRPGSTAGTSAPPVAQAPFPQQPQFAQPGAAQPAHAGVPMDEELWIISRPPSPQPQAQSDGDVALPGTGQLMARQPGVADPTTAPLKHLFPVPLRHTDVQAQIAGYIAMVDVKQQYHNPYDGTIEAVYVFPLPSNAAVSQFVMTVGDRKIRGIIRERDEAEKIYAQAKQQGYIASLLTQERPNIFTQSVANIEPGKAIDVSIRYCHTLEYIDGWYEFVFPMVVGPRFNPSQAPPGSEARVEVSNLRPSERSGHDISLSVAIDPGLLVEEIACPSHRIVRSDSEPGATRVALHQDDTIPNKDFVLRYKIAGDSVKTALLAHRDERGGFFTLMIVPPEATHDLPRKPVEMVFALDVSGSMSGRPIELSRRAIESALQQMRPGDTFQIIRFAGSAEPMSPRPLPATPQNIEHALRYIHEMRAGGGTMMLDGIRHALSPPGDQRRLRFVMMLTDGYIGNEIQVLREVQQSRGDARVFSFGVGSAPNRFLLDGMARLGAGVAAYISLQDRPEDVVADFFQRISRPALTDVSVDWGDMQVSEVFPRRIGDVFVGRPVILIGRFAGGGGETTVTVRGRVGGEIREFQIPVNLDDAAPVHQGIAYVWARRKITDLADRSMVESQLDAPAEIRRVALEHGVMSAFTAFVAVDGSAATAGETGRNIVVPAPMPAGVRYETPAPER